MCGVNGKCLYAPFETCSTHLNHVHFRVTRVHNIRVPLENAANFSSAWKRHPFVQDPVPIRRLCRQCEAETLSSRSQTLATRPVSGVRSPCSHITAKLGHMKTPWYQGIQCNRTGACGKWGLSIITLGSCEVMRGTSPRFREDGSLRNRESIKSRWYWACHNPSDGANVS